MPDPDLADNTAVSTADSDQPLAYPNPSPGD
jgi:hypothetical protein